MCAGRGRAQPLQVVITGDSPAGGGPAPFPGSADRAAVASCRPDPYPEPLASLTGVKRRRPGQKGGVGAGEAGAPAWVVGVICEERRRAC